MLTYITTYYDNLEYLDHLHQLMLNCTSDKLQMIIVDDFSADPVEPHVRLWNDPRVHVFRVTENKGFNSHGARNLAMQHSTTEWNVLIDIDYKLVGVDSLLQQLENDELEPNLIHHFPVAHVYDDQTQPHRESINDFLITKTLFWKAGGYDPEFIGLHHGDRAFLARVREQEPKDATTSILFDVHLEALRSPFTRTYIDYSLTDPRHEYYSKDRTLLFISPDTQQLLRRAEVSSRERHQRGESANTTPFTWEQLL